MGKSIGHNCVLKYSYSLVNKTQSLHFSLFMILTCRHNPGEHVSGMAQIYYPGC